MRSYTPRKFEPCALKTRILRSVLLILSLTLLFGFAAANAAGPAFSGGSGTSADPYLISTAADLVALANTVNSGDAAEIDAVDEGVGNYYGYYFRQTGNIDLSGIDWEPIGYSGDEGCYFAGNYDGGNFSITNAVSDGKVDSYGYSSVGIFGWVYENEISNLHVKNADFKATGQSAYSFAGGIAGVVYGADVRDCSVTDSKIESDRNPSNNNAAGGVVGYSTGGTFVKCASAGNQVTSRVYSGGFVGEVDDSYDAGYSSFTNCYTAECTVIVYSANVQDTNLASGFMGTVTEDGGTDGVELENCYVFDTEIALGSGTAGSPQKLGVFGNFLWPDYDSMITTNCYYGSCGSISDSVGTASEKSAEAFADGTVTALLGSAFVQGEKYPVFWYPADYSKVDQAIEKAQALIPADYVNFDNVTAAVNAVVRGKGNAEQAQVDAMARAIEAAIAALIPAGNAPAMPLPETGDGANLILWSAFAVISLIGMVILRKRSAA